jgi:hypothetical protein
METWDEIRALLDLALRGLAVGLIGLLGYAVTLLVPIARTWLAEKITSSAMARLTEQATGRAAQIVSGAAEAATVSQQAMEMASAMPQAMKNAEASVEGVGKLIARKVAEIKVSVAEVPKS